MVAAPFPSTMFFDAVPFRRYDELNNGSIPGWGSAYACVSAS